MLPLQVYFFHCSYRTSQKSYYIDDIDTTKNVVIDYDNCISWGHYYFVLNNLTTGDEYTWDKNIFIVSLIDSSTKDDLSFYSLTSYCMKYYKMRNFDITSYCKDDSIVLKDMTSISLSKYQKINFDILINSVIGNTDFEISILQSNDCDDISSINFSAHPITITLVNTDFTDYAYTYTFDSLEKVNLSQIKNVRKGNYKYTIISSVLDFGKVSDFIDINSHNNVLKLYFDYYNEDLHYTNFTLKLVASSDCDDFSSIVFTFPITVVLRQYAVENAQEYSFVFNSVNEMNNGISKKMFNCNYKYTITSNVLTFSEMTGVFAVNSSNQNKEFIYNYYDKSQHYTDFTIKLVADENCDDISSLDFSTSPITITLIKTDDSSKVYTYTFDSLTDINNGITFNVFNGNYNYSITSNALTFVEMTGVFAVNSSNQNKEFIYNYDNGFDNNINCNSLIDYNFSYVNRVNKHFGVIFDNSFISYVRNITSKINLKFYLYDDSKNLLETYSINNQSSSSLSSGYTPDFNYNLLSLSSYKIKVEITNSSSELLFSTSMVNCKNIVITSGSYVSYGYYDNIIYLSYTN